MIFKSMLRRGFALMPATAKASLKQAVDAWALRNRHRAACRQLVDMARQVSERCLEDVRTLSDWQRQRPQIRQQLADMLALDPLPPRTPLHAEITGVVDRGDCQIEKLVFQSRPGLFVTANFYLPKQRSGKLPCVIYLNGHWPSLDGAKIGFQDRYLWYPANGFALLVVDPCGFGEIPGVHPGTNRHNQWQWLSLGYTPAAVEVWNAMRAIDWLETRPEIDGGRLGVTGVSGGGVMTQFLAALDERVAAAAPSCSTYTLGALAVQNLLPKQCDCTFYPNTRRLDFPAVLALVAPRPLLILGGRYDPIFPPAGFREAHRRASRIYGLFPASAVAGRLRLLESKAAHIDTPRSLAITQQWMCRWLRDLDGEAPGPARAPLRPASPQELRCTASPPAAAVNAHVQDLWIAPRPPAAATSGDVRRKPLEEFLRGQVFSWFPQEEAPFRTRRFSARGGYAGECTDFGEYEFDSEPGTPVQACLLRPRGLSGPVPLVIWIKGPGDHVVFPDLDDFFPVLRTHALVVLTPRFADRPLPAPEYARVERLAAVSGRSMAALQVWDVMRAVSWAMRDRGVKPSDVAVAGTGDAGVVGLYAAVLDPRIRHVILRQPPSSHFQGPALPMILRQTDLPEVAGLLVPRRLTLISRTAAEFASTQARFVAAGCGSAFRRARSFSDALRAEGPDLHESAWAESPQTAFPS